jgi:hypothetical protein
MFWGVAMHMRLLGPLDDVSGADALRDLASRADDDDTGAVSLAHRLGGLPLALHLAGTYLGSSFARWHSFSEYMSALDSAEFLEAVADLDDSHADPRSRVAGSWELSVNALADRGVPQARTCSRCSRAASTSNTAALLLPEPAEPMITIRPEPSPPYTACRSRSPPFRSCRCFTTASPGNGGNCREPAAAETGPATGSYDLPTAPE